METKEPPPSSSTTTPTPTPTTVNSNPPSYGSHTYWQDRYQEKHEGEAPYHSWYFSYQELRPLLLPLLLGGAAPVTVSLLSDDDDDDEDDEDQKPPAKRTKLSPAEQVGGTDADSAEEGDDDDDDDDDNIVHGEGIVDEDGDAYPDDDRKDTKESDEDELLDDGEWEEENDEDDESVQIDRGDGLASTGAVSVLEVGCGDMPLGVEMVKDLIELERTTESKSAAVVDQVMCTDYSEVVVEKMKEEHKDLIDPKAPLSRLEFQAMDARKLPGMKDGTFSLVIDKGTLDAMISAPGTGIENCVQIVTQCCRVLKTPGCIVLVSHYNASEEKGILWLHEAIQPGLLNDERYSYEIECHSHPDGGPAVYVIHKQNQVNENEQTDETPNTVPVQFFSYG